MLQSNNISGKPIISQILSFIPREVVYRTAAKYKADRYIKTFRTYDHLITLLYAVLSDCSSLRELSTAMLACEGKLNHLGIDYFPKRSTLSDANRRRDHQLFEKLYYALLKMYQPLLSDSCLKSELKKFFIMDSTVISLFKDILKGIGIGKVNGKRKGGLKIHTLINASQDVPCLVNMTAAACSDVNFFSRIKLPQDSWLIFDRGYRDYRVFASFTEKNIFFVTREHQNAIFKYVEGYTAPVCTSAELVADRHIHMLKKTVKLCLRRIVWKDFSSNKTFVFITNNFSLPADVIAGFYKKRWQIETLFKRLKQNFCIKYFLGDSTNAIKIQVWVCLIAHLILKVIQIKATRKWAFSNLSALIKYHLMSYIRLFDFLSNPYAAFIHLTTKPTGQMSLFPT